MKEAMDRAKQQTCEEWLEELERGKPVSPKNKPYFVTGLQFDHHRTTKTGSVVLSFNSSPLEEEVVAFFNCDIRRQRGPQKGQTYPSGRGGQFLPPQRGKFRNFWLKAVGKSPRRWAAVHKELKSKLKSLKFAGLVEFGYTEGGRRFRKVIDLRIWEPGY